VWFEASREEPRRETDLEQAEIRHRGMCGPDDVERAKRFYGTLFGWQLQVMPEMGYTIVQTTEVDERTQLPTEPGAINGGMMQRSPETPAPVLTRRRRLHRRCAQAGGVGRRQRRTPRTEIPGMGAFAYFEDPEGNARVCSTTTKIAVTRSPAPDQTQQLHPHVAGPNQLGKQRSIPVHRS
jgi:uncharacterized protein